MPAKSSWPAGSSWLVALLGLPAIVLCDPAWSAAEEQSRQAAEPTVESGEPPAVDVRGLDLRIDPSELPAAPAGLAGAQPVAPDHDPAAAPSAPGARERGLSFGFELKRRSQPETPARTSEADEPGLEDNLERLIDRSAIGLRGMYRF